jgi:hypothetical protein
MARQHSGRQEVAHLLYRTPSRPPIPMSQSPLQIYLLFKNCFVRPYAEWLAFVTTHPNTPLTISTSYGDNEQTGIVIIILLVVTLHL